MRNNNNAYRKIPKMDFFLEKESIQLAITHYGKTPVLEVINRCLDSVRLMIQENSLSDDVIENLEHTILQQLQSLNQKNLKPIINGTGIVLHTNLGRSPLPTCVLDGLEEVVTGYSNLEYDLLSGTRGERYSHIENLICKITGAEAAFVVNNNAGAALLMISALCNSGEIIVSRGEQIEIGGKFRIPDIINQSGSRSIEIGTTNRTRIEDYENAITESTRALLKVHTSNYKIVGFTQKTELLELVDLGKKYNIPVIEDLGSGTLIDFSKYGLKKEPTVMDSVSQGADLISFSGDKLLGGPQAGIIIGKKKWIDLCKKHPLTRALRVDKFTIAILENIFRLYSDESYAMEHIPVLNMLTISLEALYRKAVFIKNRLDPFLEHYDIQVIPCDSLAGGGSLPEENFKSYGINITSETFKASLISEELRNTKIPIIVRIVENCILIDVRTIFDKDIPTLTDTIINILTTTE